MLKRKKKRKGFIMKKIIFILAVLVCIAPAMAVVEVSCDASDTTVTVSYDVTGGDTNLPRAFALDITVDSGATITSFTRLNDKFWVHPGSINIVDGDLQGEGNAVASQADYPADTLGGVGTAGITVEMGSLYEAGDAPNTPTASEDLFSFVVSGDCTVSIAENTARGGVVIENVADITPALTGCVVSSGPTCCPGDGEGDSDIDLIDFNTCKSKLLQAKAMTGNALINAGDPLWPCN
jgi:hypothetical protein